MMSKERNPQYEFIDLSYQVGPTRVYAEIYKLIVKRFNVEPAKCIMVDDKENYFDGARQAGMKAVRYKSVEQFVKDLELIL